MMTIETPLTELKGVGSVVSARLEAAGLATVGDLIEYFPRKYDDYSHVIYIGQLKPGLVTLKAHFSEIKEKRVRRGLHITEAVANDDTGRVKVIWFNQPYRAKNLQAGKPYYISGEFVFQNQRLQITNPSVELVEDTIHTHTARILATYRESGQLTSVLLRKLVAQVTPVFATIAETMPAAIIKKAGLMSKSDALRAIHLPESSEELARAKERLGFEELFVVMMAAYANRTEANLAEAVPIPFKEASAKEFVAHLPFTLTDAQRKTVWQIYKDIDSEEPMNRLVEGDVGSGKTVIAAMTALMVAEAGMQVAFLAPTELLAQQHANTLAKVLAHSPLANKVALLTGGVNAKAKKELKNRIKENDVAIVVGTHAILQESVDWHHLGLVIVDEQHRFGVQQRQKLHTKAGHMPHVLCLTATPIPRSLALTVYGELDISILDQAPSTRAGVTTSIVSPNSTKQMYEAIDTELKKGRQAYVVCPLITESDVLQVASAEKTYEQLTKKELKGWRVGLLHGRMKSAEKDEIMRQFSNHEIDVLVSTTVIEVGVDVANATVMVILGADRFGLAQLHQLRGRVGRAEHKGHCYLVMTDSKAPSKRMRAIAETTNGFELAELDLEIRGPGAIYGTRQHGALDLRIAQLSDVKLIAKARMGVKMFIESGEDLLKYKQIAASVQRASKLTYLN
ncbi:MAG: ATP-dependent DNA helicase RecG [Candidatus Saccharimonadales bacterium]